MASQITNFTIVYTTVYSGADQRKHQSSTSLAFVREIQRWSVKSPHKWPITREMFPFDDVIISNDEMSEATGTRTPNSANIRVNLIALPLQQQRIIRWPHGIMWRAEHDKSHSHVDWLSKSVFSMHTDVDLSLRVSDKV